MVDRITQLAAVAALFHSTKNGTTDAFSKKGFPSLLPRSTFDHKQIHGSHMFQSSSTDNSINDQREGMADAFAALDSLSFIDKKDSMDEVDAELKEELFSDMMGDMSDLPENIAGNAVADFQSTTFIPEDVDGIGSLGNKYQPVLTTEDVTDDFLSQEDLEQLQPNMEDLMSKAFTEAIGDLKKGDLKEDGLVAEIVKTAMQDEAFEKKIGAIFDNAADKMKNEIENIRREHIQVLEEARHQGISLDDPQMKRLAEAQESAAQLIKKVAEEKESVQQAMDDLERVKREASMNSFENNFLSLKKGGIAKQAAFVAMALLGSRAVTETILVVGSPNGGDHTMPAILQGIVALACGAYFYLVK